MPRTVRMLVTATADRIPGVELSHYPEAEAGQTYRVWTNSHGAVVAVMDDGNRLGLRPAEFEVDSWHHLAAEPAPQPHPEPIAWMVGTAIWWTKEEAERDAAATGLPIVGLGPMTDRGEAEQLREVIKHSDDQIMRQSLRISNQRAQLAERDALLRDNSGKLIRLAAHLISAPLFALQDLQDEDKKMTRARVDKAVDTADARLKDAAYELRRIADALSASAGPSSPTWSCQACQVEQPTDRACDACAGQTALITARS
ncbi:hypothetical protein ACF8GG_16355 [Pseudomonas sp. yb_1]|uniref:hypothetical protein n=1 Tax=Pseudomonas sp. yb_1 TaxID=3367217 RepID=UPI00370BFFF6